MKRIWCLAFCFLTVMALLLTSCKQQAAPTQGQTEKTTMVKDSLGRTVEKPRYGGTLTAVVTQDTLGFDEISIQPWNTYSLGLTNEMLLQGDWAKGLTGSGKDSYQQGIPPPIGVRTGAIAESWDMPDDSTLIYHIRKGIRFQNKAPTSGRELTADDVVFSMNRIWNSTTSYLAGSYAAQKPASITATDKWTVTIKFATDKTLSSNLLSREAMQEMLTIVPRDMVEKFGDMRDWKNSCGTGAYALTEYVAGSSMTFQKNPNYWYKNPLHPNDQLPYLDGVNVLVMVDASTRLAAFRTGKIDIELGLVWQDAKNLLATDSSLKYYRNLGTAFCAFMRVDQKPFDDIRVRRAMNLAVNKEAIAKDYYGGEAEVLACPFLPTAEHQGLYTPLKELPADTQELYSYNPDKAKQLLADAGYSNGFKTNILVGFMPQEVSVLKSYWDAINVNVTIDIKDYAAWTSLATTRNFQGMVFAYHGMDVPLKFLYERTGAALNWSNLNDPGITDAWTKAYSRDYYLDSANDYAKVRKLVKDAGASILGQALWVQFPTPYTYNMWWPWVKGYSGEFRVSTNSYPLSYLIYPWVDQNMKTAAGH